MPLDIHLYLFASISTGWFPLDLFSSLCDFPLSCKYFEIQKYNQEQRNEEWAWSMQLESVVRIKDVVDKR